MNSYLAAIAAKLSGINHLAQFHAQLILNSLHQNTFWVSLLITQCTRFKAPISYTQFIFNSVNSPNVYLHTCMLKFYSSLGSHQEIFSLFHKMQKLKIRPHVSMYPVLIKSGGKSAILFHAHVVKLGIGCDYIVRNGIIDMYVKFGSIEIARKVFDEMPERCVADWNIMISGYWRWGLEFEARKLFDVMPERNVISWTCMVSGCSRMKDLENARMYFDGMPEKNIVSWNAMLSGYAQNGFTNEALKLFKEMLCSGTHPNERTWVAIISACSSSDDPSLVETLVGMLDEKRVHMNSFIQTALIDMYAKCGNLEAARNVFDKLGGRGNTAASNAMISAYARVGDLTSARDIFYKICDKDVISWNSMIAGYAQNGQSLQAIELFKQMITTCELKPDEVTMVSVLSACAQLGALESGISVVDFISKENIKLSNAGYNAMIFMYSRCGTMKDALRVFEEMDAKDVICYNTLIAGFAAHGNGIEAIELLSKMEDQGMKPDNLTYLGVLTACSHRGLLDKGRKIFESIDCPSVDHYASMVDLLGRVGQVDEALSLVKRMPWEPHAGIYGSLLNASRIHKRVEVGELAANKLFELEPNNPGNYVLLSNLYSAVGRWKDVQNVRKMMKERAVSKATGWSFVEYGGKIRKFIAEEIT